MKLYLPWCFTSGQKLAEVQKEFSSLFKQQYPKWWQTWTKTDYKELWEAKGKCWKYINYGNNIFDTHFLRLSEQQTRAYTLAELHDIFLLKNPFISLYLPLLIWRTKWSPSMDFSRQLFFFPFLLWCVWMSSKGPEVCWQEIKCIFHLLGRMHFVRDASFLRLRDKRIWSEWNCYWY